jgi:hypothetical protein
MMLFRWVAAVSLAGAGIAGLVAAPSVTLAATSTKPREIVVVGSKLKKKRSGDILIERWQRSPTRAKGLKSK